MAKNDSKSGSLTCFDAIMFEIVFWSPAERNWDLRIHSRPFVRPFVISRSQNPFIGLFWFLAQSCSIISIRKWHFRFFVENSKLALFLAKNGQNLAIFWPKNSISFKFDLVLTVIDLYAMFIWNIFSRILFQYFCSLRYLIYQILAHFRGSCCVKWPKIAQNQYFLNCFIELWLETFFILFFHMKYE